MKPRTFAQKIFERKTGLQGLEPGTIVTAEPDILLSHDNTSAIIAKVEELLERHGVKHPESHVVVLDHVVPAANEKTAISHKRIREYAERFNIKNFFDAGEGICHQVVAEKGLALPGSLAVGSDSHTCTYGALNCFSTGIDRTEAAALLLTGRTWFKVPQSMKIALKGKLVFPSSAKDLILNIIGTVSASGADYKCVEFHGDIQALGVEERLTMSNMAVEMGAKAGVFPFDSILESWLSERGISRENYDPVWADEGAHYSSVTEVELEHVEPLVSMPHKVDNVKRVEEVQGLEIHQFLIGTCTNGRLSDFEVAARILQGKRIKKGARLLLLPASRSVLEEGMEKGIFQELVGAGGILLPPGCGPCLGAHMGVIAPGERCLSTANRNFKGRMGSREGEIILASPATVAASAIRGRITHPGEEV